MLWVHSCKMHIISTRAFSTQLVQSGIYMHPNAIRQGKLWQKFLQKLYLKTNERYDRITRSVSCAKKIKMTFHQTLQGAAIEGCFAQESYHSELSI